MIRLIGRRLIIPQGDTGTFTIPTQGEVGSDDIAIFSIYDTLTQQTVCEKTIPATPDILQFHFVSEDTLNIEPNDIKYGNNSRYVWDITIIRGNTIDSYYAGFSLPPCVIKRVTRNV